MHRAIPSLKMDTPSTALSFQSSCLSPILPRAFSARERARVPRWRRTEKAHRPRAALISSTMFSGPRITDRAESRMSEEKWLPTCPGPGQDGTPGLERGCEWDGESKDCKTARGSRKRARQGWREKGIYIGGQGEKGRTAGAGKTKKQNAFSWHCGKADAAGTRDSWQAGGVAC